MVDFTTQKIIRSGDTSECIDQCVMTYDERFLRRKVVQTSAGKSLLVDLEKTTSLDHGDTFVLEDDRKIAVAAADEPLYEVVGEDLVRLAWHIGNRHTPCQITPDRLLIQADPVIGHMLEHLGATLAKVSAPFTPEGGAYGHGRTHSHEHGATSHEH